MPPVRLLTCVRLAVASATLVTPVLLALDAWHGLIVRPWEPPGVATAASATLLALGLATGALFLLAIVEAVVVWLVLAVGRRLRSRFPLAGPALIVSAAALPLLYVLARVPFGGTRFRGTALALYGPWIALVALAISTIALCTAGAWVLSTLVGPCPARTRRRIVGALVTLAVVAFAFDTYWQAPWYGLVHAAVSLAAVILFQGAALGLLLHAPSGTSAAFARAAYVGTAAIVCVLAGSALADRTAVWRVATGTVFGARVLAPTFDAGERELMRRLRSLPATPDAAAVRGGTGAPARGSQVLLFTVDTLRRDAVGASRTSDSATPRVDEAFRSGRVFRRAYAQYAATRHSVRTLFYGRYKHEDDDGDAENLVTVLRDHGLRAIAVMPEDLRLFVNLEQYNFSDVEFYSRDEEMLTALQRVRARTPPPYGLMWVHAYAPHAPYEPPREFVAGAGTRARYLGEVRWMDRLFGETLAAVGPDPGRLLIFGADHGEEFGEHGASLHGHSAYEEVMGVPLMVAGPGVPSEHVDTPVANIDIAPTVLGHLGIPAPSTFAGRSLLERADPSRWIYAETVNDRVMALRGADKWIVDAQKGLEERYDTAVDPAERRNLAGQPGADEGRGRAWLAWFSGEGRTALGRLRARAVPDTEVDDMAALPGSARCLLLVESARRFVRTGQDGDVLARAVAGSSAAGCQARVLAVLARAETIPEWACDMAGRALASEARVSHPGDLRLLARCPRDAARGRAELSDVAGRLLRTGADAGARETALIAMHATGSPPAPLELDDALADPHPRVRAAAVRLLGRVRHPATSARLAAIARSDVSPRVRASAVLSAYEVDAHLGRRLAQREIDEPALPDAERVQLLADTGDPLFVEYLTRLFVQSTSAELQGRILRALPRLVRDENEARKVRGTLSSAVFDPELRSAIARLRRAH